MSIFRQLNGGVSTREPYFHLRKINARIICALFALAAGSAIAAPDKLYDATDSRSRVTHVAYAYYPDKGELRVRLTLANNFEKYALYRDTAVIQNVLTVLRHDVKKIQCVYRDNDVIALIAE